MIKHQIVSVAQFSPECMEKLQKLLNDGWHVAHATALHGFGYGSISATNGEVQYVLSKYEDDLGDLSGVARANQ